MSEISNKIHCNELRTLEKSELLLVLESVDTNILMEALWNKINSLESFQTEMFELVKNRR